LSVLAVNTLGKSMAAVVNKEKVLNVEEKVKMV
jgi:hypothetical protein